MMLYVLFLLLCVSSFEYVVLLVVPVLVNVEVTEFEGTPTNNCFCIFLLLLFLCAPERDDFEYFECDFEYSNVIV